MNFVYDYELMNDDDSISIVKAFLNSLIINHINYIHMNIIYQTSYTPLFICRHTRVHPRYRVS